MIVDTAEKVIYNSHNWRKKMAKEKIIAKPKKKTSYIRNKDLLAEVIKCREEGKMSDELAKMLTLLTARYGRSSQFGGYTFNEDMQAYAMMMLCKTWVGFNPEKGSNAFAYYTQCIKSSFKQFLNREKRQRVVRDELLVSRGLNPSFTYTSEHSKADQHFVYDEEDHGQVVQDMKEMDDTMGSSVEELISFSK